MPPVIDPVKCSKCSTCADICPMHVFSTHTSKEVPSINYPEECWHCNACVLDCPKQAVSLRMPINYTLLHIDATQLNSKSVCQAESAGGKHVC